MKIAMPILIISSFAFSQMNASASSSESMAAIEKLENSKFEIRKDSVISKIKAYYHSTFSYKLSIDSILFLDFFYDDTKPDWQNHINEYSYEIWAQVDNSHVAKYTVFTKNDSVTKYVMDIKADVKNDPKLAFMNKRLATMRAKSDSIQNFMSDNEDRKFLTNKKAIEKNVIGYLRKVYKVINLDSLALSDFTYNDSLPDYWNKITQHEYDAWVIYKSSWATKIKLYAENGKIVKSELIDDANENDDKVMRMQEQLDQLAFIRENQKFKSGQPAAIQLATKCLKEYANDPSSVKISKIYFHSATASGNVTYHVVYRGRNGYGAIVLGTQAVTTNGSKCIDISNIDTDDDE